MAQTTYVHLSLRERDRLANLRAQGLSNNEIARRLHRNKGTISRELRRNCGPQYRSYGGGSADLRSRRRRAEASRRDRLRDPRIRSFIRAKLRIGWSPEQIAAELPLRRSGCHASYEAIYQFIYDTKIRKHENLVPFLARAHWKRQRKGHRHTHRDSHIYGRISVRDRPQRINSRKQFGHWETDLVISRRSPVSLSILVERKSHLTKLTRVKHHTPQEKRKAIIRSLRGVPQHLRRSITYDNGHENLHHLLVNKVLGTKSFFCEPYHSWEKGTVENTVGLVRRVFPKRTDFALITNRQIKCLERRLNARPRKCLHFKTPNEVFSRCVALHS